MSHPNNHDDSVSGSIARTKAPSLSQRTTASSNIFPGFFLLLPVLPHRGSCGRKKSQHKSGERSRIDLMKPSKAKVHAPFPFPRPIHPSILLASIHPSIRECAMSQAKLADAPRPPPGCGCGSGPASRALEQCAHRHMMRSQKLPDLGRPVASVCGAVTHHHCLAVCSGNPGVVSSSSSVRRHRQASEQDRERQRDQYPKINKGCTSKGGWTGRGSVQRVALASAATAIFASGRRRRVASNNKSW